MTAQDLFLKAEDLRNQEQLEESIEAYQKARDQAFKESNM